MSSIVTLYKACKIVPTKGFLVESLDSYLSTLTSVIYNNTKLIKQDINVTLKIDTKELDGYPYNGNANKTLDFSNANGYNYVKIMNQTTYPDPESQDFPQYGKPFFYFIHSATWTSHQTVTLELILDSINTFKLGVDYSFDKKTQIHREHKDRVYNSHVTLHGHTLYRRKVDFLSEGVNSLKFKTDEDVIDTQGKNNWYLIYNANNTMDAGKPGPQASAVSVYVCSDEMTTMKQEYYKVVTSWAELSESSDLYFGLDVPTTYGRSAGQSFIEVHGVSYPVSRVMCLHYSPNQIQVLEAIPTATGCLFRLLDEINNVQAITFPQQPSFVRSNLHSTYTSTSMSSLGATIFADKSGTVTQSEKTTETQTITSISQIDRTYSTLMKIIALPYPPMSIEEQNGIYLLKDNNFKMVQMTAGFAKLNDYLLQLKNINTGALVSSYATDFDLTSDMFTEFDNTGLRNDANESKLFHSDFYTKEFVYDSFSLPVRYETVSKDQLYSWNPGQALTFDFVTTSSANSRFLFKLHDLELSKSDSAYDNILNINRNNEYPLYNNEWINYVRTGYNYDKKTKDYANVASGIGIGSSALSAFAGTLGFGGIISKTSEYAKALSTWAQGAFVYDMYGNKHMLEDAPAKPKMSELGLSAIYGTSQFASGIGGIVTGIMNIQQTNAAFKQKREAMKMSGASIVASDDLDLLEFYSNNKAKMCEFEISSEMKGLLADLFYYYGYVQVGQGVPNLNTRKNFNYIQCDAVLNNLKNIYDNFLEDLKERYALGVTVLHKVNNSWDFSQTTANNESWL